jgi:very-short-patch-repair endonuclease
MELAAQLRSLCGKQHGYSARWQAWHLGAYDGFLDHRVSTGEFRWMTPRVLELVGTPPSRYRAPMAAVLDAAAPAVLSHFSAAWLWRLPGFRCGRAEVTLLRGDCSTDGELAVVHRPRLLLPSHITDVRGVPATTLGRTLFDIAPRVHPERLEIVVDRVLGRSPGMLPVLRRLLDELAVKGRPGIRVMRSVLDKRPPGYVAPATGLELRFTRILDDAGEKPLVRQVDIGGHDWLGRVDFVDWELLLRVEVDSITYHTTPLDLARDAERDESMAAAGFRDVLRVAEEDIWYRPWKVVAAVRAKRSELRRAIPRPSGTGIPLQGPGYRCQNEEARV